MTAAAHRDIAAIKDFIAKDRPDTANRIAKDILSNIQSLATNPRLGIDGTKFGAGTDLLCLIVAPYTYMIFYRLKGERPTVSRVLDGRRDYLKILKLKKPSDRSRDN
jgi:plasmid stabilization system protein ParE